MDGWVGSGREGDLVVEHFGVGAVADDNAGNGIAADVVVFDHTYIYIYIYTHTHTHTCNATRPTGSVSRGAQGQ